MRVVAIRNGHPMMARVTGRGCTATALVGAFIGSNTDRFTATVAALATLGVAGEIAAAMSTGPGSLGALAGNSPLQCRAFPDARCIGPDILCKR